MKNISIKDIKLKDDNSIALILTAIAKACVYAEVEVTNTNE